MGRVVHVGGRPCHLGGRRAPKVPHRLEMHASRYGLNLGAWPVTPSSTSYGQAPAAQAVLSDILGNDQLGCCTEANSYHLQALRQAAAGLPVFHPTLEQVIATYSRDGGYVPGQPNTDQGCDETVVLANAQNQGITNGSGVDKIAGYLLVDPTNRPLVRAACTAFVGGSICMSLPDAWVTPMPGGPGWTWDVPTGGWKPDPNNGHCYTLLDQSDTALTCGSWAMPFTLTYDALAAGASDAGGGALYFLVDNDILMAASQRAPDGLDWATLIADFNDAGGNLVAPGAPAPTPTGAVTLAMAQSWVAAGIQAAAALETQAQAIAAANAGLAQFWTKP